MNLILLFNYLHNIAEAVENQLYSQDITSFIILEHNQMCVCLFVCIYKEKEREKERERCKFSIQKV